MIYWLGCQFKLVRWLYWKLSGGYYKWGMCGFATDCFGVRILEEPPNVWNDLMDIIDIKFNPQANHDSLLDGTEFCGNCGLIKKYGHKTAFRTSLDCKCK